jgi:hypothetical protein
MKKLIRNQLYEAKLSKNYEYWNGLTKRGM